MKNHRRDRGPQSQGQKTFAQEAPGAGRVAGRTADQGEQGPGLGEDGQAEAGPGRPALAEERPAPPGALRCEGQGREQRFCGGPPGLETGRLWQVPGPAWVLRLLLEGPGCGREGRPLMLWKGRQLMPPKLDLIGLCFGEGGFIVDAWVHGPTLL